MHTMALSLTRTFTRASSRVPPTHQLLSTACLHKGGKEPNVNVLQKTRHALKLSPDQTVRIERAVKQAVAIKRTREVEKQNNVRKILMTPSLDFQPTVREFYQRNVKPPWYDDETDAQYDPQCSAIVVTKGGKLSSVLGLVMPNDGKGIPLTTLPLWEHRQDGKVWYPNGLTLNGLKTAEGRTFFVQGRDLHDIMGTAFGVAQTAGIDRIVIQLAEGDKTMKGVAKNFGFKRSPSINNVSYKGVENDKGEIVWEVWEASKNTIVQQVDLYSGIMHGENPTETFKALIKAQVLTDPKTFANVDGTIHPDH